MWIDVTLINFDHIAHIHRETHRKRHGEFIGTVQCLGEYMLNSEVVWIDVPVRQDLTRSDHGQRLSLSGEPYYPRLVPDACRR